MKQRIPVTIAGTSLTLVTDEPAEYVEQLAKILDTRITQLSAGGKYTKLETLLLLSIDLLDDHVKDTAKRRDLESQIAELTSLLAAASEKTTQIDEADDEA